MKQNKQMYVAPKVELIEMELQGILCASNPTPQTTFNGEVMTFGYAYGNW